MIDKANQTSGVHDKKIEIQITLF